MITQSTAERLAEREKRLRTLCDDIYGAVMDSDNLRDQNVLAMILLVRALDIFSSNYDEPDTWEIMEFMFNDRLKKRKVPTTQAYAEKQLAMQKWLP